MLWMFQILHLAVPVSFHSTIIIFGLGTLISVSNAVDFLIKRKSMTRHLFLCIILGFIAIWLITRAILPVYSFDAGLYHFNCIRWINEYHIIPGLGNVHDRFAFNSSFFTWAAALNFFPLFGFGHTIANSYLLFLLLGMVLAGFSDIFGDSEDVILEKSYVANLAGIAVVPICFYLSLGLTSASFSSPNPDISVYIFEVASFYILAQIVTSLRQNEDNLDMKYILVLLLSATMITLKLSTLAFSFGCGIVCILLIMWSKKIVSKCMIYGFVFSILIVATWMLRGFILSGAPLFPSTLFYASVDWAVPKENIRETASWVYSWARTPMENPANVLGSWLWLPAWFERAIKEEFLVYYNLGSFVVLASVLFLASSRRAWRLIYIEAILLIPPICAIPFWFFTAPDPRFAGSVFVILLLASTLVFSQVVLIKWRDKTPNVLAFAVFILFSFMLVSRISSPTFLLVFPTSGISPIPLAEKGLSSKKTDSNLTILVPRNGKDDLCWDSPIPSTTNFGFNPNLRLRRPEKIEYGFTVLPPEPLFSIGPDSESCFISGWSYSERLHRWTDGKQSTIHFKTPESIPTRLLISGRPLNAQFAEIKLNGTVLFSGVVSTDGFPKLYILKDLLRFGESENIISFSWPNASISEGQSRMLGFKFEKIEFH